MKTCQSCQKPVQNLYLIFDPTKKGGRLVGSCCLPKKSSKFPYPIAKGPAK